MDNNGKILLISGGVLAVVVATLVSILVAGQRAATPLIEPTAGAVSTVAPGETALYAVVISRHTIRKGTLIGVQDVNRLFAEADVPVGSVMSSTVFSKLSTLTALLSVVSRKTTQTIIPGEQITAPLFNGLAAITAVDGSLSTHLADGYDAETLSVDSLTKAVNGEINVNDRVDVIYSRNPSANWEPPNTSMLIQGATVIATGPLSNTYTLALKPHDAVRLAHVKDAGWSINLVLRSIYDASSGGNGGSVGAFYPTPVSAPVSPTLTSPAVLPTIALSPTAGH